MYTEIIRSADKVIIKKGDRFYLNTQYGKFLKKITWLGEHTFEWNSGWCNIGALELNPNMKSSVKFELYEHKL